MSEEADPILGYCQSNWKSCPGGRRPIRSYKGLDLCCKCWPHRKAIVKMGIYRRKGNGPEAS
jgi:hypothetical protein